MAKDKLHRESRYLGDGVHASFDGLHIWLTTGSPERAKADDKIALEPSVFAALVQYQRDLESEGW